MNRLLLPLLFLSATMLIASGAPIQVLIVGGGNAHDFERWFHKADAATLARDNLARVTYTKKPAEILPALQTTDVLLLCNNQPIKDAATRAAIFDFVDAGNGVVLLHPAVWYNWADWPEYNRKLAGGGSRGHDRFGKFTVDVTVKDHPLTRGLPESFPIVDELYYFKSDPNGSPVTILATAHSRQRKESFPMVWTVKQKKARVACIALGHDGKAHEHPDFQRLLRNAIAWAAAREDAPDVE